MNRSESFSQLDVHGISAHLSWATLNVMVDSVPDIHMLVSGSDDDVAALHAEVVNGVLCLDLPMREKLPNIIGMQWMLVTVRVPADWRGSFDLHSISGNISLGRIRGTDLDVESLTGSLIAEHLQAISLTAKSVSGTVSMNDIEAQTLRIQSVSGTSAITRLNVPEIHLFSVSGQSMLTCLGDALLLDGSTVTGHVVLDLPTDSVNASLKSVTGKLTLEGVTQNEQSPMNVHLSTISGSVQILHSADTSTI